MALSDVKIRKAKPKDKGNLRLWDGGGLYCEIRPTGSKVWMLKYRLGGKERRAVLGHYDGVSLIEARDKREEAKKLIRAGIDPVKQAQAEKYERLNQQAPETFGSVALAWVEEMRPHWSARHATKVKQGLEKKLIPEIGKTPISAVTVPLLVKTLKPITAETPAMSSKVNRWARSILDHAVTLGLIPANPAARLIVKGPPQKNYPAILEPQELRQILKRGMGLGHVDESTRRAHFMVAVTCLRIGELLPTTWAEVDLTKGEITIPRSRMKRRSGKDFVVPLAPQVVAVMKRWKPHSGFVFPSPYTKRPITREGVEKFYSGALGLKGQHSPHSWRSAFSSVMHDKGADHFAIEASLDHLMHSSVAKVYDRGTRLDARRKVMAAWAKILLAAK